MEPVIASHIEMRETRSGVPRAFVCGTRVRVQDIAVDHELHGLSPEQIAREYPHISLAKIHAALAYYFDHRDEIREQMKQDEEFVLRQRATVSRAGQRRDGHGDTFPS
jgi:uncharacterized protein (DUF433 family)